MRRRYVTLRVFQSVDVRSRNYSVSLKLLPSLRGAARGPVQLFSETCSPQAKARRRSRGNVTYGDVTPDECHNSYSIPKLNQHRRNLWTDTTSTVPFIVRFNSVNQALF